MNNRSIKLVGATILVASLALAGCGDDGDDSASKGDVVVVIGAYPGDPDPAADVLRVVRVR